MAHTSRLVERFKLVQQGSTIEEIPHNLKVRERNGNGNISKNKFNSNYRHLKADKISNTIPASFYSSFIHPTLPRNITSREAARLQSFPDYYVFKGKRTLVSKKLLQKLGKTYFDRLSQYNQIGNAVPPLLSKAIGLHLGRIIQHSKEALK
jgi:DNA (cytosine-5)-methyltransferase 1